MATTFGTASAPQRQTAANNWNLLGNLNLASQPGSTVGPGYGYRSGTTAPENQAAAAYGNRQSIGSGMAPYTPGPSATWYPVAAGTPGSTTYGLLANQGLGMMPMGAEVGGAGGNGNSGGAGTSGGTGNGLGTTSSSITPSGVFSNGQTQRAINQSAADSFAATDPRMLQQRFARPGRSLDAGMMAEAMPGIAAGETAVGNALASIPLQDYVSNQNNLLQGQVNQGNENMGLANILRQLQGNRDYVNSSWQGALASLLGSMV